MKIAPTKENLKMYGINPTQAPKDEDVESFEVLLFEVADFLVLINEGYQKCDSFPKSAKNEAKTLAQNAKIAEDILCYNAQTVRLDFKEIEREANASVGDPGNFLEYQKVKASIILEQKKKSVIIACTGDYFKAHKIGLVRDKLERTCLDFSTFVQTLATEEFRLGCAFLFQIVKNLNGWSDNQNIHD